MLCTGSRLPKPRRNSLPLDRKTVLLGSRRVREADNRQEELLRSFLSMPRRHQRR